MRILGARIFLSLLAGKLKPFEQMLLWKKHDERNWHSIADENVTDCTQTKRTVLKGKVWLPESWLNNNFILCM